MTVAGAYFEVSRIRADKILQQPPLPLRSGLLSGEAEFAAILRMIVHAAKQLVVDLAIERAAILRLGCPQSRGELSLDVIMTPQRCFAALLAAGSGSMPIEPRSHSGLQHDPPCLGRGGLAFEPLDG